MDFRDTKAIYLQIADRICDEVLVGKFAEDSRIPSVREYAAVVEVNANTVMRSFDQLQSQGIIYNKRGIGYFVAAGARERILRPAQGAVSDERGRLFFQTAVHAGHFRCRTGGDVPRLYQESRKE